MMSSASTAPTRTRPITSAAPSAPGRSTSARSTGMRLLLARQRVRLLAWRQAPVAPYHLMQQKQRRQRQIVKQVAPPETPGFAGEAMRPLQPDTLHPHRRALRLARQEVECAADPHAHGHAKFTMLRDPRILARSAERDEERIWASGRDRGHDRGVLFRCEGSAWRRLGSSDHGARGKLTQSLRRAVGDA